ncbi:DUF11 domain-containing protein [Plantactinospora sp. S1510]|uniref:DUF11 domain-containing protein n=1 Tax=Plantactinospora alkalitolerans TaxID=2789879 RepID=A0ABS0H0F9_9ACTN|nr:DUF11 domain-containing protein [Plantactinospora alkalitolerans]MBF9131693.1 DUF11 domain-containing protein [Plantactinospora alkalitolerans]
MPSIAVLATALVAWAIAAPVAAMSPPKGEVAPKPSATPDPKQPLLSIAVDNGRTAVAAGDELTYKVRVRNLGTTETRALQISQSLPAGLTLVSADRDGTARAGSVTWSVNLKAGKESTLTTVARVGQTSDEVLRLATVACATVKGGAKPLVCATHSDLLPAGAAVTRVDRSGSGRIRYGIAAGAVAVVGGLAAIVTIARRRRQRRPEHREVPAPRAEPAEPVASAPTVD